MTSRLSTDRERTVASVAVACLDAAAELEGPTWVAGDGCGELERRVAERGAQPLPWRRLARPGRPATGPWPGEETAAAVLLRLPKGRQNLEMSLHALLARVQPGAPVWLFGANDEGIRSAAKTLAPLVDAAPHTLLTKRHCRVWAARAKAQPPAGLKRELEAWAERVPMSLPGGVREFVSFPGIFAHGRLDPATALLLETLHEPPASGRLLDFGAGCGVLAAALSARGAEVHALDPDALALAAVAQNLPDAKLHGCVGLQELPTGLRFDLIVANPPLHQGRADDRSAAQGLAQDAPAHLHKKGELRVVVPLTVPFEKWLKPHFARVDEMRRAGGFRVLRARGPQTKG